MPKAKQKTTGRNLDAEDTLTSKLTRAIALTHLLAQAANNAGSDPESFHLGLETIFDLLTDAEDARSAVTSVLNNIEWPKPEPVDPKPLDKATAAKAIKAIRKMTKPVRKVAPVTGTDQDGLNLGGAQ